MNRLTALLLGIFAVASPVLAGTDKNTAPAEEKTSIDLFTYEANYIFPSDTRAEGGRRGQQDEVWNHFSYGHRFQISGQWYLRAGLDLQRYDFGSSKLPLPSRLQGYAGTIAVEYVEQDYAGAALELHPGAYFEDSTRDSFDIAWDAYSGFVIRKDKLFGIVGVAGARFYSFPVYPIFGVIWLVNDKLRIEAVVPKSTIVYSLNDDWEFDLVGEFTGAGFRAGVNEVPRLSHAAVEYYDSRLTAQFTYSRWKPLKITGGFGWIFNRTFDYFNAGEKFSSNGAPCLKFGVEARF